MQLCPSLAIPAPSVVAVGVGLIETIAPDENDCVRRRVILHLGLGALVGLGRRQVGPAGRVERPSVLLRKNEAVPGTLKGGRDEEAPSADQDLLAQRVIVNKSDV